MDLPRISVIVPVRKKGEANIVLASLNKVNYPRELIEFFIIEGNNPSSQRNTGIARAAGEIIFFFDDDSDIDPNLFRETVTTYSNYPEAIGVGGPACLSGNTYIEQATVVILTSILGVYKIRARYKPVGKLRYTNEDELISCNLSIKGKIFENGMKFNRRLYPNEENELISRLLKNGCRLIYNPNCVVWRKTDSTISQFLRRIFSYGRGRAEQLFVGPSFTSFLRLAPLLFLLYLFTLIFNRHLYLIAPLCGYFIIVFIFSLYNTRYKLRLMPLVFILYILTHISYGLGEAYGILRSLKF